MIRVGFLLKPVILMITCLIGIVCASVSWGAPLANTEALKVIELKGKELTSWMGEPIANYSLHAVQENRLVPIPYQIDEYDIEGNVFFKKSGVAINGEEGTIDLEDKLMFMLADAGYRKTEGMRADGQIVAEVTLTLLDGENRFVYVVKGARLQSEEVYVRYASQLGRVETDEYTLTMSRENALNWETFSYSHYTGEQESPLDTMKLRLKGGLVVPFPKVTLNNKNFVAIPYAEKVGPIRATTLMKVTLYLLKMPLLKFDLQVHHSANRVLYITRVKLKRWQRAMLWNPTLTISLDGNDLQGMEIRTAGDESLVAIVDNEESDDEREMKKRGIDVDHNWIWARSGHNLDILSIFNFLDDQRLPISFVMTDDKNKKDKPERFSGQSPNIGYRINDIPKKGFIGLDVDLFLAKNLGDGPGWKIAEQLLTRTPLVITEL